MVDVMHYEVLKKHEIEGAHLIAYLFKSDGGRFFSAVRSPSDVQLQVGDVINHHVGNIWESADGSQLKIEGNIVCSNLEEAEQKFQEFIV
ncbi:hypothetical protein [Pantoea vagans]|uniref:hypothetical protein n=1 Tax=Pantoea vagans TaxID=470934 RepID=UPI00289EA18A|nr:hypothetical protein [Pantoea vagans]